MSTNILVQKYITKLKSYYSHKKVKPRVEMVSYIINSTQIRQQELAKTIGCSTGHLHQIIWLGKNLSNDELNAIDDLKLTAHQAYKKTHKNID